MARFCNINYNQFINNVGYLKTKSFFPIKFEVCTLLFNIKHLDILKRYQFDVWFYICHKHVKIGGWVSIETCSILLETELNFIYNTTIDNQVLQLILFSIIGMDETQRGHWCGRKPEIALESLLLMDFMDFVFLRIHKYYVMWLRSCVNNRFMTIFSIKSSLYIPYMARILSFKRLKVPEKYCNQTFLVICKSTHGVQNYYKVSWNCVQRFKRSCAYNTIGLTD